MTSYAVSKKMTFLRHLSQAKMVELTGQRRRKRLHLYNTGEVADLGTKMVLIIISPILGCWLISLSIEGLKDC